MDALKLLKRLRAEKATAVAAAESAAPQAPPDNSAKSPDNEPDREIWEKESLLVREWQVGEHLLRVYEDPCGTYAAGNGATLWSVSLALSP